jgi:hypothetical protein
MVTVIPGSNDGTLGFVISGRLTRADYEEVLLPPIRETIASGEEIRILAVIEDFRGLEAGALREDLLAAAKLGFGQRSRGTYFAVVTDTEWVRRGIGLFGWLVPGEIRVFTPAQRAEGDAWLASAGATPPV